MVKKYVLRSFAYWTVFCLLCLTERRLGLYGIAAAFLFALLYTREKPYIFVPLYAGAQMLVSFSLDNLIFTACAVVLAIVVSWIHHKKKWKFRILETALLTFASQIPVMALCNVDPFSIALTALGVLLALGFHAVSILALYPVLIRGMRYKLSGKEAFAFTLTIAVLSVGLSAFRPFGVGIFYFVGGAVFVLCGRLFKEYLPLLGVASGVGGAIGTGDIAVLACFALISASCFAANRLKAIASSASLVLAYLGFNYFFGQGFDLFDLVPLCVGAFLVGCVPQKLFDRLKGYRQSYQERFALRTVVNRDRESVSNRLKGVAVAFREMQNLLMDEEATGDNPSLVVRQVCESGCFHCVRFNKCNSTMGDVIPSVKNLVVAALDNGKATLLDAGVGLGENCTKLASLIGLTNDTVNLYRKNLERKSGIEQGKEMVVAQLGGVAHILSTLAKSVNCGLVFDAEPETRLIEQLGCINVIASDVMVYESENGEREVALVVRETDMARPGLSAVVSEVMGCEMVEYNRLREVKNMVSLFFCRAPVFNILYGESAASRESRCGDTRQAVKIGNNKLMFVLSDGMGTGENAYYTASHVILLIETFYKAGFDHKTIFSSVARLLSLRSKEDFSALDVAVVDTQTGDIDFIKQGGRESYIFSDGRAETIDGGTLPMGIVAESEPKVERRRLRSDDIVLLLSDGVCDVMTKEELTEIMNRISGSNPQEAADAIVRDALRLGGAGSDDMTVIAFRLTANAV